MQKLTEDKPANSQEQWLSIGQAAEILGVSVDTLRRWEKAGKIKAYRSPSNRRIYHRDELKHVYEPSSSAPTTPTPTPDSTPSVQVTTETVPPSTSTIQVTVENVDSPELPSPSDDHSDQLPEIAEPIPTLSPPTSTTPPSPTPITEDTPPTIPFTPSHPLTVSSDPETPDQTSSDETTSKTNPKNIQILKTISIVLSAILILLGLIITVLVFI